MLQIEPRRAGLLLCGLILLLNLGKAQVPVAFDSIAGIPWDSLSVDKAMSIFPETGRLVEGPAGRAYLMGGGCVPIPGDSYLRFQQTGVVFVFTPPDSTGAQRLRNVVVSRKAAVATPDGIDVGDEIIPPSNSYGTRCNVVRRFGEEYLEIFEQGVFYYCLPASLRRAERGKAVKVSKIGIRENY